MGGQYGVKETLEVLDLGFAVAVGIHNAQADGKIDLSDIGQLFPVAQAIPAAVADVALVLKELEELDADDQAKVLAYVAAKLPGVTDNARVKELASTYLMAGLAIANAVYVTLKK